jgi:hypothetical protein
MVLERHVTSRAPAFTVEMTLRNAIISSFHFKTSLLGIHHKM